MKIDDLVHRPEARVLSPREKATEKAIHDQFLALLKKRPIEKISVADLCSRVGINRSTFYRHYDDLYALLDSIVAEAHSALFYDVIAKVDLSEDFDQVGYRYIYTVCETTEKQKGFYKLLMFGKTPTNLAERMMESSYHLYEVAHDGPSDLIPSTDAHLHYRFLVSGMVGVWTNWVREDCQTDKDIVARAILEQIRSFYMTMGRLYGKE